MMKLKATKLSVFFLLVLFSGIEMQGQDDNSDIKGRWDLVIKMNGNELPSWLEIYKSGHNTLVGRFVFASGSARPISEIEKIGKIFSFRIPRQWEPDGLDLNFTGRIDKGQLNGNMTYVDGTSHTWTATRAPNLEYNENPKWGNPIQLFNTKDIGGWHVKGKNEWIVENGILKNQKAGGNLITDQKFTDFKLHLEFRYPKGSNSGIYLRGRYEVQIEDNQGMEPSPILFGGIYGFLSPNEMVARAHGEWQEYDITLIGRRVTIIANGKAIINDQIIPGITGGALDSSEGEPGPIFIQGDHGPIDFRSIVITPIK